MEINIGGNQGLLEILQGVNTESIDSEVSTTGLALESAGSSHIASYNASRDSLATNIAGMVDEVGLDGSGGLLNADGTPILTEATSIGITLAAEAAIASINPSAFFNAGVPHEGGAMKSSLAIERFDPAYSHDVKPASVYYALLSNSPEGLNQAINAVFVPYSVGNSAGISIKAPKAYILSNDNHGDGTEYNPDMRSIATVLDQGLNHSTVRVLPVRTAASAPLLVDPVDVPIKQAMRGSETVDVSPYKFSKLIDFIGMGQTMGTLALGKANHTDTLDHGVRVASVFMRFGADVIRFNTMGAMSSLFTMAKQGKDTLTTLNLTDEFILDNRTLTDAGLAPVALNILTSAGLTVKVKFTITGNLDLASGEGEVFFNGLKVVEVLDATGLELAPTDVDYIAVKAIIDSNIHLGYNLDAKLTNSNRRNMGDILEEDHVRQHHVVRLKTPITVRRPVNRSVTTSDLNRLVTVTTFDKAYQTVHTLKETAKTLDDYMNTTNAGRVPRVFGVGSHYLNTYYKPLTVDLAANLNSISHAMRKADMQALLMGYVHELGMLLYINGGYSKAIAQLYPGHNVRPTLTILCSERMSLNMIDFPRENYNNVFDIEFHSLPVDDLDDEAYAVFNFAISGDTSKYNYLNFGIGGEGVELVYNLKATHSNASTRDLSVTPRWDQFINAPVLGKLKVTKWLEALGHV